MFEILNKEPSMASTDALFSLPVFLTSSLWKRSGGPVFLYSFDHPSPFSASVFSSSPFKTLTDAIATRRTRQVPERDNGVGHGEDLFYLFEPKSLEGEDLPEFELTTPEDSNVLDLLTSTIATFVKTGQPKVGTQFKFCEIGLWGGKPSRLLTPECREAFNPVALLQGIPDAFSGIIGSSGRGTPKPSGTGGFQLPGLLG
ncbi:hypothetical protein J437_LFUL009036 [Ladona fulva]|uniref:Carboxylesterase type B domain-containing protein n=1 Tax=Ladona fulva TaxID=123851 RepID=A0A8K0K742_LADFU|nr:hypothetical protein J437_LFUL009036 [Ladona fulva]